MMMILVTLVEVVSKRALTNIPTFYFQQTQELLEESQSLQNRIHLASQAQEASKTVEQDYEEVRNK